MIFQALAVCYGLDRQQKRAPAAPAPNRTDPSVRPSVRPSSQAGRQTVGRAWGSNPCTTVISTTTRSPIRYTTTTRFKHMSVKVLYVAMLLFKPSSAVVCAICKDTIAGCTGGDACPLVTDITSNAAIFEAGRLGEVPNMQNLLPPGLLALFPRNVCELIVGIASGPSGGRAVDFSAPEYAPPHNVARAAIYGYCTAEQAILELLDRQQAATGEDLKRLGTVIDMLRSRSDTIFNSAQGVYSYIYARITTLLTTSSTIRINMYSSTVGRATATELSCTLKRPGSSPDFFELLFHFVNIVVALGLANYSILSGFITETVFKTMRELQQSWEVAHELFLLYLREIEWDSTRLTNFANVYNQGKQDTLLAQARSNAAAFFRTRGGAPRAGTPNFELDVCQPIEWNGQSTEASARCCVSWNLNKDHNYRQLSTDGTCLFAHRCMQYVSDKGPYGQCRGNHRKSECKYDESKKLAKPLKA